MGEQTDDRTEPPFPPGCAWMDGAFVPIAEAKLSVLDWGFLRSDATYDVVHVWEGRFFRLDLYLDHFLAGVERLHMTLTVERSAIAPILAGCVDRAGLQDSYVEMICTRGRPRVPSRDPRDAVNRFMAFAIPFGWILGPEDWEAGLHLRISPVRRIAPESVDPTVKNYHWLDLTMGLFDAYESGAETVVLTDGADNVVEGPGFNIFALVGGGLVTPDRGVLEGITRRTVFELCVELDIPARMAPLPADAVRRAPEVFVTSTAGGIMPVTAVDGRRIGEGKPGPVTRRLYDLYWAKHDDPAWSTAVSELLARPAG